MGQRYNAVRVSKTTAKNLVKEIIESLDPNKIDNLSEKELVDTVGYTLYNGLRRQANRDKVSV